MLGIGDGFSFCRGFPGVIRVVDCLPPVVAAVVAVATTSGAATSSTIGDTERSRAYGEGGHGGGGGEHDGTTNNRAGSDTMCDDRIGNVMDDSTKASAAATAAAAGTDYGDADDGSDVRCKNQKKSNSRRTRGVSSDSCGISDTMNSVRMENSLENTETFEMPVPQIIYQEPHALSCSEVNSENIIGPPRSGGGCDADKDEEETCGHAESVSRGNTHDRRGSVSPSDDGQYRQGDETSMVEQPSANKAAAYNSKPPPSARQPTSPPPPPQAAAPPMAAMGTLEGLRVALIKLGLSRQRRNLFRDRAAQFGAEAVDWPITPSSLQVAANNNDGAGPEPPPGLSPATARGAASLLGSLARNKHVKRGKGKGKKRARQGSSWQTSGVRGTPRVPPTPPRRRRDQLVSIPSPPQNLDHIACSAKRSEQSVAPSSTKRSGECPLERLSTRSVTNDSDDPIITAATTTTMTTTGTTNSGNTGCATAAGSDVAGRDGSGSWSSGYRGGGSSVVAELIRLGFTHAICAAGAPRRALWAELGLLPEPPAVAPVREGGGDGGGSIGEGMAAEAAVEIVSEEWLVNCLREQVSERTCSRCVGADAVSLLLW